MAGTSLCGAHSRRILRTTRHTRTTTPSIFTPTLIAGKRVVEEGEKYVVICPFAGIGGDLVALEKLGVPVKAVITMELDDKKCKVLERWMENKQSDANSTFHKVVHYCWGDICQEKGLWMDLHGWEVIRAKLDMKPGYVIISGGSPCDNQGGTLNRGSKYTATGQSYLNGASTGLYFLFVMMLHLVADVMMAAEVPINTWDDDDEKMLPDWASGTWANFEDDKAEAAPERRSSGIFEGDLNENLCYVPK